MRWLRVHFPQMLLIVEDSSDDAILIQRAFMGLESCKAVICRNVSEAKAYLDGAGMYGDRHRFVFPNAIISDLHLGFESGVDLLKWVKSHRLFKDLPVFIMTGTATSRDCAEAREAGAVEVLRKPARHEDLKLMVQDLAAKVCGIRPDKGTG